MNREQIDVVVMGMECNIKNLINFFRSTIDELEEEVGELKYIIGEKNKTIENLILQNNLIMSNPTLLKP